MIKKYNERIETYMKKIFGFALIAVMCFALTSCYNRLWDGEHITLYGKIKSGIGAEDNIEIQLDRGWFVIYQNIVLNYKDSVLILPLVKEYNYEGEKNITIIR